MKNVVILETLRRVGYEGRYILILPDNTAGKPHRYSVYLLPSSPSRPVQIVGRELNLPLARRIARQVEDRISSDKAVP
jgi:hypothetical protein